MHFDGQGSFAWRALVHKTLDLPGGPRDAAFNIEHFILTNKSDVVVRDDALSIPSTIIDLGSGSNTVSFHHANHANGTYAGGTTNYRFSTVNADSSQPSSAQVQTVNVDSDVDHTILAHASSLSINNFTLLGGAANSQGLITGGSGETYTSSIDWFSHKNTLTIQWPQRIGAPIFLINITNWQQGDFGIQLR